MSVRVAKFRILLAAAAAAAGLAAGCVPLPLELARPVAGVVVDAESGEPLADALVVVRFEGLYDDVLPEPRSLGHREARTGGDGRFRTSPLIEPGLHAWPWLRIRARIAAVRRAGYRCVDERPVRPDTPIRIELEPALDREAERSSCRPVAAAAEAPRYTAAWRELHKHPESARPAAVEPARERAFAARMALGHGANCRGPVIDLSLAPDGGRAALLHERGSEVEVRLLELAPEAGAARRVAHASAAPARRLAWIEADVLALEVDRIGSWSDSRNGGNGELGAAPAIVWRSTSPPAARAPSGWTPLPPAPLGPALGAPAPIDSRAFRLVRSVDPGSGRVLERLRVSEADGSWREIPLPGEACVHEGRFGRPEERVAADGRTALDLRFVEGGCRAVAIDLDHGTSRVLDVEAGGEHATCAAARALPRAQLALAFPDYEAALAETLERAGVDPAAAFRLRLDAPGGPQIETADLSGRPRAIPAPAFPMPTPLRRIDISVLAARPAPPPVESAPPAPETLQPL